MCSAPNHDIRKAREERLCLCIQKKTRQAIGRMISTALLFQMNATPELVHHDGKACVRN